MGGGGEIDEPDKVQVSEERGARREEGRGKREEGRVKVFGLLYFFWMSDPIIYFSHIPPRDHRPCRWLA